MSSVEKDRDYAVRRRLGFVRHLLDNAKDQASQAPPMCFAAILSLHDAAEIFLALACEVHDAGPRNTQFLQYFNHLSQTKDIDLSQKRSMGRLNDARVALKHHGTWPSQETVKEFAVLTELFLNENCKIVFGCDFEDIHLIDFVVLREPREHLTLGYEHAKAGDHQEAVRHASIALEFAVRASTDFSRSFGGSLLNRPVRRLDGGRDFHLSAVAKVVEKLELRVGAMESGIAYLALGVDPIRLRRFRRIAPSVGIAMNDEPYTQFVVFGSEGISITLEDMEFCLSFATEACIALERKRGL